MQFNRIKIVIVGAGNVGEAIGYTLMLRKQASEIVFVDINTARAEGSAMDILHGTAYLQEVMVRPGDYSECADADLIIVTAGLARKPGQTRLDLAKVNTGIAKDITESILKYNPFPLILVVSNPVDIMTYAITRLSGLPAGRVIGTGTSLDTARLRCLLAEKCQVNVCDIDAYICGEHGDSQVTLWSGVSIGGEPLSDYLTQLYGTSELDRAEIDEKVRKAGAEIIARKGATFYGVAAAVARIVDTILKNQHAVLPVSHILPPEFGPMAGMALSLPCLLDSNGIVRTLKVGMNEEERAALTTAAEKLRKFIADVLPELPVD